MRWFVLVFVLTFSASQPAPRVSPVKSSLATVRTTTLVLVGPGPHIVSDMAISTTTGPCIEIQSGVTNVIIQRSFLGPCKGAGVNIYEAKNVTIQNNTIERAESGVLALESTQIYVYNNLIMNNQGPFPRGQCFQSDKCTSPLVVRRNWCLQEQGQSNPEDNINLYMTEGSASAPVRVEENVIIGGGPSRSGCGVLVGDSYGQYQMIKNNVLINPGQCGIGVASGFHMSVLNNTIISTNFSWTNTGLYVWLQYNASCSNITVIGNLVNWKKADGQRNDAWNGGNCGEIAGFETTNSFYESNPVQIRDIPLSFFNNAGPAGIASCTDGERNQHEVDVDCGGECDPCMQYIWSPGEWGGCSVTCGGGIQTRPFTCVNGSSGLPAPDMCGSIHLPESSQNCNDDACPAYSWRTGDYAMCSTTCGGGIMTRAVQCISSIGDVSVPLSYCSPPIPSANASCNTDVCVSPRWVAGGWGPCSAACGGGNQTRTIVCKDTKNVEKLASQCTDVKPSEQQACNTDLCPAYNWTVCPQYYPCTAQCNGGTGMLGLQYRDVFCVNALNLTVDPILCSSNTKPNVLLTACNPQKCAGPNWMANSNWGPCTLTGSSYVRTRSFHCHTSDGAVALDSVCSPTPRPVSILPCVPNTCLDFSRHLESGANAIMLFPFGVMYFIFSLFSIVY